MALSSPGPNVSSYRNICGEFSRGEPVPWTVVRREKVEKRKISVKW